MANERVMVYIDGSNLYHSLRAKAGRINLDFLKFAEKLVGDRRLVRVYYYNVAIEKEMEPESYEAQQRFFKYLMTTPYLEVREGRLVYRGNQQVPVEKGVDIKIATDMVVHACKQLYDVAVLVSGDTDFRDALQAIKDFGMHAEVALLDRRGSGVLRDVADRVIEVDNRFLEDCWVK